MQDATEMIRTSPYTSRSTGLPAARPGDPKPNMGETEAWLSAGVGAVLIGAAFRRGTVGALPLAAVGASFLYRASTRHCPLYAAAGIDRSSRRSGPDAVSTITIDKPAEEVYRFWRNLSNLPQFMAAVESVEVIDETRSRWRTRKLGGQSFEYEAEITEDTPGNGIRWKSVSGSPIEMRGSVRFKPSPAGRGTIVISSLIFGRSPGSGLIGHLASPFAKYAIHKDLLRLKRLLETGEIPSTEGQPVGPKDADSHQRRPLHVGSEGWVAARQTQGAN